MVEEATTTGPAGPISSGASGPDGREAAAEGERAQRFREDLTKMHVPGTSTSRERNLARLGAVLLVAGPVWVIVCYFISHSATSSLQQNDALVGAVFGLSLTVVGLALFLRYAGARFLRFWLARISYEQHLHTTQVVEAIRREG